MDTTRAFATTVLVLMAVSIPVDSAAAEPLADYKPHITPRDLEGKITTTTFVLEQPRCNFTDVVEDDRIWLLVARSSAYNKFTLPQAPQNLSYHSFDKNSYYMTLDTAAVNYPCAASPDEITVLRVGSETSCMSDTLEEDCNGPLPDAGPYRVRFIARRPNGTVPNGDIMYQWSAESKWSDEITLIQGRDYTSITTSPRRSGRGSMIAIASVLSILLAILLASFIAALVYKYSEICGKASNMSVRDSTVMTHYTAHRGYDHPTSTS